MPEATDNAKPAARKPLSRSEAARHASLVRWGKEQPFAARLAAVRDARKGRKPRKGRAPAKTPEQRDAERSDAAQARYNETADTLAADGAIEKDALGQLSEFASGAGISEAGAAALEKMGLIERGSDGTPRLSAAGRGLSYAADRGDVRGALDAIGRGRDAVAKDADRAKANADKEAEKEARAAEKEKAEKEAKPKGGGGGGKGKGAKEPSEAQQRAAALQERVMYVQMQRLARGGRLSDQQAARLIEAGLVDDEGRMTPAGRRFAMSARERQRADDQAYSDYTATVKHGSHNQLSHGRRTARRRASLAAYRTARAGGASVADARQIAKDAGLARQGERDARLSRMQGRDPAPTLRTDGTLTKAYGSDPNQSYAMQHRLVDMADIQASNTPGGAINPHYDPTLQPRDRSRAASQAQIDTVARQMNPDVLTTDFHRIDAGSPIVDAHGNVLSGNGRTLALQRAAEHYPEQYAAYRAKLKEEAAALGIDPAAVDRMKNPVLVRELKGDVDAAAFAREANSSGTLRMSPLEQAKVDAAVLHDTSVLKLNVGDAMDIDRALRDKSNKPFVDDFLKTIPENERANLLTRGGDLNQMGLYRMKAAIYTKAFPGAAGERLAESMLESLDPDVKTIQNGISGALPSFSRATSLTRSGLRDRELDISDDIAKTIDVYARIKDNPHLTANTPAHQLVRKYLDQSTMFDRELTGDQERLLVHLDKISRKPTEVRSFLDRYARIVEDQPVPGQASLFGDSRMTRAQLYDTLLSTPSGGGGGASLFDRPGQQQGAFL